MNILISGASGLIGRALRASLEADGHSVSNLTRRPGEPNDVGWSPSTGEIERSKLEGFDAVVHLAGESIDGRWSDEKKEEIRASRVRGTRAIAEAIAALEAPPAVLVSASAIGYYGDRDEERCDEASAPGDDFFASVCQEWEAAASSARATTRVVHPRSGIVLSSKEGALARMLPFLRLGLAGPLGSGRQWWSWISLRDEVRALRHLIDSDGLEGPINLVAHGAARNAEFIHTAGRVVGRPTVIPAPAFGLRLMFGEMADAVLLASTHVLPTKLLASGFSFEDGELEQALRHELET